MNSKRLVLIVEDEEGISNFISAVLTASDYAVIKAVNGKEALEQTASHSPDVILLDLGLPDMEGLDVLRAIRVWSRVPIIVVSARDHEREKVAALDLGADDYITKPFGTSELLARIRTALRHIQSSNKESLNDHIIRIQNLSIDDSRRLVKMDDTEIHFTPIEYKILLLLARHAGKVLTHDFIIREIWGPYSSENQALRVNMSNIRRKIEKNPAEPAYILTEVGVGYRMAEE
ncbi:response regulator transcription factor [Listeria sp. FSL L7-1485]|uniref:Response regulator transcription factor n=1 Tax=Listeria immobilis TaxID=2713502 RepID=A0A7X0X8K8_9LIST|nr:response regulator transcription factor [Listeria immobilis]MBC1484112.1 response regulator transcription factor [Listeria immobilis]MBC1489621.1 response regulator transcription factor [Listeria immobilis]MBC1508055.1 response regulator transcription factor [Listeria immobilis]MBC1511005.1 response regulator transcription factor [Listeria immobilis]MBC1516501.1 response regulator transcription factor [Listeria immobilis]